MNQGDANVAGLPAKLAEILGSERVITDADQRTLYSCDLYAQGVTCLAVIRPRDTESLSKAIAAATDAGCAIFPRGGGMSYVEGYTPTSPNSIVVDTTELNRIIEINADDMYITVEAGVTWKQIYDALLPLGLRLPYFGTFSGAVSTIGGGLSHGASFFGSARYGSAAEIVLALEVCLADGTLIQTGQSALAGSKPVFRAYGPDLTGLFVHDCGALGIKTRATLRLIRTPESIDFLSCGFTSSEDAIRALSEIARAEVAEDACIMDPTKTKKALTAGGLATDLKVLASVASSAGGVLKGLRASAGIAMAGRKFADGFYSLNMTLARANPEALKVDIKLANEILKAHNGTILPDSIPRATRAYLFPAMYGALGPKGERWAAVNAKIAHSQAVEMDRVIKALIATRQAELDACGVEATQLFSAAQNHIFSYEVSLAWQDEWLPLHTHSVGEAHLSKLEKVGPNLNSRALAADIRAEVVKIFADFGAASNQLARTYPYASLLNPGTGALLKAFKAVVDPRGLMNPGALGL